MTTPDPSVIGYIESNEGPLYLVGLPCTREEMRTLGQRAREHGWSVGDEILALVRTALALKAARRLGLQL